MEPGASLNVKTTQKAMMGKAFPYYIETARSIELKYEWKVAFITGGPILPPTSQVSTLGSWTNLPVEEVKNFSGTAQYSIHFSKPFEAAGYVLDLGSVQESAEVLLNGKKLAVLIGPSYKLLIPVKECKDDNLLQVNVTNVMANRIADLERRGVVWKKFYNTNFPSRLPQNRGVDGIFTAAKWAPRASGLLGPVLLRGVKFIE